MSESSDDTRDKPQSVASDSDGAAEDIDALRERVEAEYDFDDFGPDQMAEMSAEEWDAAFDADTWIVGEQLLDRVERDLLNRVARRDVFAVVERYDGSKARIVAYSDEGYAVVYPDGSIEGRGTVLRDVKPSVALCSMDKYDVPEAPADGTLPTPEEVPEGSGEFGNLMLQIIAATQLIAGLGLGVAWLVAERSIIAAAFAIIFFLFGLFLFFVVANARLSDRFRAEQFRDRLRATGVEEGARPEFLPESARPDQQPLTADDEGPEGEAPNATGPVAGDESGGAASDDT
jgi:hypothetical protein